MESGELDVGIINEASGLEISTAFPGRLYHVNDSGDAGRFYVTGLAGAGTEIVSVDSFYPLDVEDIALGACGSIEGNCLFIGDFGDNAESRPEIGIVVVPELERFDERVLPVEFIGARYPDGPHDAEALAIHPDGDLFILTKERSDPLRTAYPSRIYRLPDERGGGLERLELVGEIDFTLLGGDGYSGSIPTAFDISDDGDRFIVLTYVDAFEFYIDLARNSFPATEDLVEGKDFRRIPLEALGQQESIAYLGPDAFLYDTEAFAGRAPIMRVRCR